MCRAGEKGATQKEAQHTEVQTRAQRAHDRLSWQQRMARNARLSSAFPLEVTIHGLLAAFAQSLGLDKATAAYSPRNTLCLFFRIYFCFFAFSLCNTLFCRTSLFPAFSTYHQTPSSFLVVITLRIPWALSPMRGLLCQPLMRAEKNPIRAKPVVPANPASQTGICQPLSWTCAS